MALKTNYTKSEYSESWTSEGIIFQIISPKVKKISLDIAIQLVKDRNYAMGEIKFPSPVFVTVNNATSIDSEANKYYNTKEPYTGIQCIAMLVNNYTARIVGNLVFSVKKTFVPTSFFNSEEKALKWLKSYQGLN